MNTHDLYVVIDKGTKLVIYDTVFSDFEMAELYAFSNGRAEVETLYNVLNSWHYRDPGYTIIDMYYDKDDLYI